MPPEQTKLNAEQHRVLQLIYDWLDQYGGWPTFGQLDRTVRKLGLQPERIIEQLARGGMLSPFQAGRLQPVGRDELWLTLRGFANCQGGNEDLASLLSLLPWLAAEELNFEPEPEQPDGWVRISRTQIAEFLQIPSDSRAMRRLRRLVELQRWGFSGGEFAGGEWYCQVDRNVYRFAQVRTLDDYVSVMEQWEEEGKRPYVTIPDDFYGPTETPADPDLPRVPELEPYVSTTVVTQLESAIESSAWDGTKLLMLIKELNDSYRGEQTYAAHALLRAILDHVPLLLGFADFRAVASNYPWTRTDRQYIKRLADFRAQADDVLHRMISQHPDVLTIQDIPQRVAINRLLQECASAVAASQAIQSVP